MISVQQQDFNIEHEYQKLVQPGKTGAVVTFIGRVREFSQESTSFYLQHYPGMTESVLTKIEAEAQKRWALQNTTIIHRTGELTPGEQIVFVGVSSSHRSDAFAACEFMIDILKTEAPFWKKEGNHWLDARDSDINAAERWIKK